MALTKSLKKTIKGFSGEVICQDAYYRVSRINGNKTGIVISVEITNSLDKVLLETLFYEFIPDISGSNFIKQAYLYLKTLPEFADAIDC
jgi:hypothetical protein